MGSEQGWRGIESAPRTGWFAVWWRDGQPSVMRFYSAEHLALIKECGATHWAPLPPPPSEAGDG